MNIEPSAEKARKGSMPARNTEGVADSVELELYISTDGHVLPKLCIAENHPKQPKIKVANAEGLPMKTALIHEAFVDKAKSEVLEAENERRVKVANGTSTDGPSVAFGWVTAARTEAYLNPVSFGFDKVRLKYRCARDFNRGKMLQGSRYHGKKCPLPGCNLKIENRFHFRSGCHNTDQSDVITTCANKQVHRIRKAFEKGEQARWTLLVNAGVKLAKNGAEDETIPGWMLPEEKYGKFGNRPFPDKVDMVLVRGWDSTTPPPATRQEKSQVKLVLVESTSSHDHHLVDAESHKRSKYVQLVLALQSEGWVVELSGDVKPAQWESWYLRYKQAEADCGPTGKLKNVVAGQVREGETFAGFSPIHTVILGHCGTHLKTNKAAFQALGIVDGKLLKSLLLDLSVLAADNLRACRASFDRLRKASARGIG